MKRVTLLVKLFILCFLLCTNLSGISQRRLPADAILPTVGKQIPEFKFVGVRDYKEKTVTPASFRGKWLVLEFWSPICPACVKSFPKLKKLQAAFKEDVQVFLVGCTDRQLTYTNGTEQLYEGLRKRMDLRLPFAFDSSMFWRWEIFGVPHVIIVDPEGVVQVITTGLDMTEAKVRDLIDGKAVLFDPKGIERPEFDPDNVGVNERRLVYRSTLTEWTGEDVSPGDVDYNIEYGKHPGFYVSRVSISELYKFAFFGTSSFIGNDSLYSKYSWLPVLELRNPDAFNSDYYSGKGYYNYDLHLSVQRNTRKEVMCAIQADLKNAFGFHAAIEERMVPVLKLKATPEGMAKIKTKGGPHYFSDRSVSGGAAGFTLRNERMKTFLQMLTRYINSEGLQIFNETGIEGNIDISMDALMTDRDQVINALRRNGLDLVVEKRLMKAIVIRDGESNP